MPCFWEVGDCIIMPRMCSGREALLSSEPLKSFPLFSVLQLSPYLSPMREPIRNGLESSDNGLESSDNGIANVGIYDTLLLCGPSAAFLGEHRSPQVEQDAATTRTRQSRKHASPDMAATRVMAATQVMASRHVNVVVRHNPIDRGAEPGASLKEVLAGRYHP